MGQSIGWSTRRASTANRCASITFCDFVYTFIPSLTGVEHEMSIELRFVTISTMHVRQAPNGRRSGYWQKLGIAIPACCAA